MMNCMHLNLASMKNLLHSTLFIAFLVPDLSLAQKMSIPFKKHESYFFSNSIGSDDKADLRYMFFKSQSEFEKYFHPAATNKPVPLIGFSANYAGGIVYRETDRQVDISVDKLEQHEGEVVVYVSVKIGKEISYRIRPSYVFSWPVSRSARSIRFITNGEKLNATVFRIAGGRTRKRE